MNAVSSGSWSPVMNQKCSLKLDDLTYMIAYGTITKTGFRRLCV